MKFTLVCHEAHEFEAWFRSNEDYETQAKRGFVECPHCGSTQVHKALMAPSVSTGRAKDERKEVVMMAAAQAAQAEYITKLREITTKVKENATDVGENFATEARAMHEGEKTPAPIYGKASAPEVDELLEDGVEVMPLPDLPEPEELN
ncbi:MAG: DUF1178 family protein [Pseudomonadota bacterium]